jgi:hypothetical protein
MRTTARSDSVPTWTVTPLPPSLSACRLLSSKFSMMVRK